jgi:predicted acyl esterase
VCDKVEVDLWSTSNVFLAGHRVRLQITNSCFPRWDRNLNTGEPLGAEMATAYQP